MKKYLSLVFVLFLLVVLGACTENESTVSSDEDIEAITLAFIDYMMNTQEGTSIVKNNDGIVTVETTKWSSIEDNHDVCSQDNSAITIKFGGSTSVQEIAEALSSDFSAKCGNFVASHAHTGSSDAYKRTQGSEKDGANELHIGFASRDFKTSGGEETRTDGTFGELAKDAVVVIVNDDNTTYTNATTLDLKAAFEQGAESSNGFESLIAYTRDSSSGTRGAFMDIVDFEEMTTSAVEVSSNGDMLSQVAANTNGIGYASLASITNNNDVTAIQYKGVSASEATVLDGTYELARPFNYIIRDWN